MSSTEVTDVRIGVLASGVGAGLRAILTAGLPVTVVVVDRPCPATEVAARHGVQVERIARTANRVAFSEQIVVALGRHDVDLAVMAGFMRILGAPVFRAFPDRVLNVHPSLLPAFRGMHAVEEALAQGVKITGCTVHLAIEAVDSGPILAQEAVSVFRGDTPESLTRRIQAVEYRLYPAAIRSYLVGLATEDTHRRRSHSGTGDALNGGQAGNASSRRPTAIPLD